MDVEQGRVAAAFRAVDRAAFLPASVRGRAAVDAPLPIGHGATNSQPWTVRFMVERLRVPSGARVLDVGSGSGWTTALLARLTGPTGSVIGVEVVPELVEFGRANLAGFAFPWARVEPALPGVLGLPDAAPFDRILVSADAGVIPAELEQQLAIGGCMVLPAAGVMWTVVRDQDDWRREADPDHRFAFVPLV
ncbi:MAG: methyltransferase domain-containing protein [Micropruina sp.]|uniref:protein-L-isoaspartate O-methyltransferase family protein n=1 Tax=Micropruina sp. TaxID=2737536 RepID=UPI0039E29941